MLGVQRGEEGSSDGTGGLLLRGSGVRNNNGDLLLVKEWLLLLGNLLLGLAQRLGRRHPLLLL